MRPNRADKALATKILKGVWVAIIWIVILLSLLLILTQSKELFIIDLQAAGIVVGVLLAIYLFWYSLSIIIHLVRKRHE